MNLLDGAHLCAEYGLHVIPVWRAVDGVCPCPRGDSCISPGKHPVIDSWQTSATIDVTLMRDWFAGSRHNVGVVCSASQICVLDVDPRNHGDETFASLQAELGTLPATVTADTGGGGQHLVFRRPVGDLVGKLGDGLDVLRDGRQFLVEPSVHPSGGVYRWRTGHAPNEIALAELPEPWIKRIRRVTPPARPRPTPTTDRTKRAAAYLAKLPGGIQGSHGSDTTYNAVAHMMFGFDLDEASVRSLIVDIHNPKCDPPWSDDEIDHKIVSCAKTCKRERGYLLVDRPRVTSSQNAARNAPAAPTEKVEWQAKLLSTPKHQPRRCYENTALFVKYHSDYAGKWSLDEMTLSPWFDGALMQSSFVYEIIAHVERRLGYTPTREWVNAAIVAAAQQRTFHPIRQYLRSVDWDGVPRLADMAYEYLGSESPLHATMVRLWMIGAVARAMNPGCKLDTALMLIGKQGFFKSSMFKILGGSWHADSHIDITDKDGLMQIHAAWIYELSELENVVSGSRESRLKAWLASSHDMFRAPYQSAVVSRPRSVAFCGTTNRDQILTDETGSRRFWIVPIVHEVDRDRLQQNRDQLWAEAVCAYDIGTKWWLDRDSDEERETASEAHVEEDPWGPAVAHYLQGPFTTTTVAEVLSSALKIDTAKQDRYASIRVGKILARMRWVKERQSSGAYRAWLYRRPNTA